MLIILRDSPELILKPVKICRSPNERVLIETSVNSIRISIKIKQSDELEGILADRFSRFLMQRAEQFFILRRKAVPVSARAHTSGCVSRCAGL